MAETGFWLKGAKGKLAGTVMYTTGGRTLQRQIVTPKNPQSDNQMRQRAAFAGASKFYQNAQQNRFALAFQNKKGNQSEFNAFMQKNLREFDTLTYPTREQANTPEFCNYFPWICTEGSLQGIPVAWPDDNMASLGCAINAQLQGGAYATNWEDLIALNPSLNLQYGDIITLTVVINDEVFNDSTLDVVVGNITPRWITRQFIIGADLEGFALIDYLASNGLDTNVNTIDGKVCIGINMDDVCEELGINGGNFVVSEVAAMICVTRSRNEGSQLKVSSSRFYLDDMAQRIFERLASDTAMREAIESYKNTSNSNITPANILQGSVAEEVPVNQVIYTKPGENTTTKAPAPATALQVKTITEGGNYKAVVTIGGDVDLETAKTVASAEGQGWTVSRRKINVYQRGSAASHSIVATDGVELTFTRATSGAGNTGFSIYYKQVLVAAGTIVVSA